MTRKKTPTLLPILARGPWAENRGGGGPCRSDSGEGARRRLWAWGGGARGGRGLPWVTLGSGWDGRRRWLHGSRRPAVVVHGGGSAPVADSGRARAWELHRREGNPFRCLAWAGNGRRWGRGVQSRRRLWRAAVLRRCRQAGPAGGEAGSAAARHRCGTPWARQVQVQGRAEAAFGGGRRADLRGAGRQRARRRHWRRRTLERGGGRGRARRGRATSSTDKGEDACRTRRSRAVFVANLNTALLGLVWVCVDVSTISTNDYVKLSINPN